MKIRLVEVKDCDRSFWKIEEQWSKAFNMWQNYYYPHDNVYLTYEQAKKSYDEILAGKRDKAKKILEVNEI